MSELSIEEIEYDLKVGEFVKDCPCSFCGRKSTARIRISNSPKTFTATYVKVIGSCDKHHSELKKLVTICDEFPPCHLQNHLESNVKMFTVTRDEWEMDN